MHVVLLVRLLIIGGKQQALQKEMRRPGRRSDEALIPLPHMRQSPLILHWQLGSLSRITPSSVAGDSAVDPAWLSGSIFGRLALRGWKLAGGAVSLFILSRPIETLGPVILCTPLTPARRKRMLFTACDSMSITDLFGCFRGLNRPHGLPRG